MLLIFIVAAHLLVLALFMHLYAKHEADISLPKIALVFYLPVWALAILSQFIGLLVIPLYFVIVMFPLMRWFYVGAGKAAAIAGTFTGYMVIASIIQTMVFVAPEDRVTLAEIVDEVKEEMEIEEPVESVAETTETEPDAEPEPVDPAKQGLVNTLGNFNKLLVEPPKDRSRVSVLTKESNGSVQFWITSANGKPGGAANYQNVRPVDPDSDWFIYIEDVVTYWVYTGDGHLEKVVRLPTLRPVKQTDHPWKVTTVDDDPDLLKSAPETVREELAGEELGGPKSVLRSNAFTMKLEEEHYARELGGDMAALEEEARPLLEKETAAQAARRMITRGGNHVHLFELPKRLKEVKGTIQILAYPDQRKGLNITLKMVRLPSPYPTLRFNVPNVGTDWFIFVENNDSYWIHDGNGHLSHVTYDRAVFTKTDSDENSDLVESAPEEVRSRL
ncbi:hypothetical protein HAHE_19250 [Haloferula helveola]|uniref:Uncharacterized protein n=1 Tax=Haloferula helveola TaxID=490095 RepID=A0ABN6H4Y2_9BACT|nr:hypothetical protein HAHE_19250 [Haloferula helveola]